MSQTNREGEIRRKRKSDTRTCWLSKRRRLSMARWITNEEWNKQIDSNTNHCFVFHFILIKPISHLKIIEEGWAALLLLRFGEFLSPININIYSFYQQLEHFLCNTKIQKRHHIHSIMLTKIIVKYLWKKPIRLFFFVFNLKFRFFSSLLFGWTLYII